MRTINVTITGMFVQKDSKNGGVQGEGNATQLHITLDDAWLGYGKRIIWRDAKGQNPVSVVLFSGDADADLMTYDTPIPTEALALPGWCSFTVEGYENADEDAGTPASAAFSVRDFLQVAENDSYYSPAEPTPSEAQQIMGAMGETEAAVSAYAKEAKSWAVGGTGSRDGEDTDNAMYYAQQAAASASAASDAETKAEESAEAAAASAQSSADNAEAAQSAMENAGDSAVSAQNSAQAAAGSAEEAQEAKASALQSASQSEQNAENAQAAKDVAEAAKTAAQESAQEAKTYKSGAESAKDAAKESQNAAELAAGTATTKADRASQDAAYAEEKAILAKSWAEGGTGTREGEDTNNAKYWSEAAQGAASGGVSSFKGRSGAVIPQAGDYTADMVGARPDTWMPTSQDVGADPSGTAESAISAHNQYSGAHANEFNAKANNTDLTAHTRTIHIV